MHAICFDFNIPNHFRGECGWYVRKRVRVRTVSTCAWWPGTVYTLLTCKCGGGVSAYSASPTNMAVSTRPGTVGSAAPLLSRRISSPPLSFRYRYGSLASMLTGRITRARALTVFSSRARLLSLASRSRAYRRTVRRTETLVERGTTLPSSAHRSEIPYLPANRTGLRC